MKSDLGKLTKASTDVTRNSIFTQIYHQWLFRSRYLRRAYSRIGKMIYWLRVGWHMQPWDHAYIMYGFRKTIEFHRRHYESGKCMVHEDEAEKHIKYMKICEEALRRMEEEPYEPYDADGFWDADLEDRLYVNDLNKFTETFKNHVRYWWD